MKTIKYANPGHLSISDSGYRKLNDHLIQPIISGFLGFFMILIIMSFINRLNNIMEFNEKCALDFIDLSLAGIGFVLRFVESLLKSNSGNAI